jgi:diguanylate cyclase (GGDEF)-like protein/PAS domain S-box-containing protein
MSLSRHILEQIVSQGAEGVLVVDAQVPDLPVVYVNAAFERQSGYGSDELIGLPWPLLAHESSGAVLQGLRVAAGKGEPCSLVTVDFRKDGSAWQCQVSIAPLYQGPGDLRYLLCQQGPVPSASAMDKRSEIGALERELGRVRQKIASLNRIDALTGLLRYDHFFEQLQRDFRMAQRDGRGFAMLIFEVAELDAYRATFGVKSGNSCLRMVAAQVAGTLKRAGDLAARYDEDSLVALVHGQDVDQVRALATRIQDNVRGLGLHNPRGTTSRYIEVRVGVAVGIPEQSAEYESPESMIAAARADLANTVIPIVPAAREPGRKRV